MAAMVACLLTPEGVVSDEFLTMLCRYLSIRGLEVGLARREEGEVPHPVCGMAELRLGGEGLTLIRHGGAAPKPAEALRLLGGLDLVISLLPPEEGQAMVAYCPPGAEPVPQSDAPVFSDPAALAGHLAGLLHERRKGRKLTVLADGKPIPAKFFVKEIIANSLHGLLAPLKGIEGARKLEVIIEE